MTQSSVPPEQPMPRSEPLILDRVGTDGRVFLKRHGASPLLLADGGYEVLMPEGTLQWQESDDGFKTVFALQLPDGARVFWFREARMSQRTGWPREMRTGLLMVHPGSCS